jgi:hypothetical protein
MEDEIIQLFKKDDLRQEVVKVIKDVYNYALTIEANPPEGTPVELLDENGCFRDWYEAWWRAEIFGNQERIEDAFRKYVFDKIKKPDRLTIEEALEAFNSLFYIEPYDKFDPDDFDFNALYTIFVAYLDNQTLQYRISEPFPICEVDVEAEGDSIWTEGMSAGYRLALKHYAPEKENEFTSHGEEDNEKKKLIWEKNGIQLSILGCGSPKSLHDKVAPLYAIVNGGISNNALAKLSVEMSRVLPSIIRSIHLIESEKEQTEGINKN